MRRLLTEVEKAEIIEREWAKARVFLLQIFEPFGLVDLQAAVLFAPAEERLLYDAKLPAYLGDGSPLRRQHFGLARGAVIPA